MATHLRDTAYLDGAIFHACHAYECAMCAFIAKNGYHIPPDGKEPSRVSRVSTPPTVYRRPNGIERPAKTSSHVLLREYFEDLASSRTGERFYRAYIVLRPRLTTNYRNEALYYRYARDVLPAQRYNLGDANLLLRQVQEFVVALRTHV